MSFYKNDYDREYWEPSFYAENEVLEKHKDWINEQLRNQTIPTRLDELEHKLLTDDEFRKYWVEQELQNTKYYFMKELENLND